MVRSLPLSVPVTEGVVLITLIRYPVPSAVLEGMVAEIVPAVVWVTDPMVTGEAKLPEAPDN